MTRKIACSLMFVPSSELRRDVKSRAQGASRRPGTTTPRTEKTYFSLAPSRGSRLRAEQLLAEQPHLGSAAVAGHLEQLQAPLAKLDAVADLPARPRLDAREHLGDATVVAVGRHQQSAERVVRARVVVPVQVGFEPAAHLGDVVEAVGVEQLLVQVGVEHLDLAVPF